MPKLQFFFQVKSPLISFLGMSNTSNRPTRHTHTLTHSYMNIWKSVFLYWVIGGQRVNHVLCIYKMHYYYARSLLTTRGYPSLLDPRETTRSSTHQPTCQPACPPASCLWATEPCQCPPPPAPHHRPHSPPRPPRRGPSVHPQPPPHATTTPPFCRGSLVALYKGV